MAFNDLPQPESRGSLVPPDRQPPTAIGTGTPEPPRPPQQSQHVYVKRTVRLGPDVQVLLNKVLDAVDLVAEAIATELGLRPASSAPSSSEPPAS